jgi:hypothetical protein
MFPTPHGIMRATVYNRRYLNEDFTGLSAISRDLLEFQARLKFVAKKASYPPLGLLTVSSMLPKHGNDAWWT